MKRYFFIIAFIVLGLCACNKVEPLVETPETPFTYHLSLQASFDAQTKGVTFGPNEDDINSQFETTDKIYVFNETKGAFARFAGGDHHLSYLQPSSAGTSCTLEGDLSFYILNGSDEWEAVSVDATDEYTLYYQMNDPDYYFSTVTNIIPRFDYSVQDGSAAGASDCDFAEVSGVTMSLSGTTLTAPNTLRFQNLQSMFRQRLSFTNGGAAVTPMPTITKLTVGTKNNTLLLYYRPDRPDQDGGNGKYWAFEDFDIVNPVITSDGDIYLSLAFYYTAGNPASGDQLILTAVDSEGNVYQSAKAVPAGGFETSKYYYGSCEMVWQYKSGKPVVTRTDEGSPSVPEPDSNGWYDIYNNDGSTIKVTISGDSQDYRFFFNSKPTIVTLTGSGNPVSASWSDNSAFIESESDLTIVLDCNYLIDCSGYNKAIECSESNGGELKLKTTGQSQTLTVITDDDGTWAYGIYGDGNFDAWMYDFSDIANLAADGFTVSCPGPSDNLDGTYTWVYTVAPDHIGKVMGADGVVYADVDAATAAGTTAEAMIAYVGRIDGVCEHGLAISLTDIESYQMDYAAATGTYAIPVWAAAHPVTGGTWRLPTAADWQYMLWGYYATDPVAQDITAFNTLLGGVGTALPSNSYFWSGTEKDTVQAIAVYHDSAGVNAGFDNMDKTENAHVRACLSY